MASMLLLWTRHAAHLAQLYGSDGKSLVTFPIFDKFGSPEVMEMLVVAGQIKVLLISPLLVSFLLLYHVTTCLCAEQG